MTGEELKEYLLSKYSIDDIGECNFDEDNITGKVVYEFHQEGGEGEGDFYQVVHYFEDLDIYIKVEGNYQSHWGVTFEEVSVTKPTEKTIIVY